MDAFSSSLFSPFYPSPPSFYTSPPYKPTMLSISATTTIPSTTTTTTTTTTTSTKSKPPKPQTNTNTNTNTNTKTKPPDTQSPTTATANNSHRIRTYSPPLEPSLAATICNALDDIINNFIDPPLRRSTDPKHILADNFAPVDELPPTECSLVEGELPPCLDGAYIRNGPNPQFLPRGPYHLFDGDGMLHSLRISNGRATLCSRYVKTYKYKLEREARTPIIPSVFSGFNTLAGAGARGALSAARIMSGQFDPRQGFGVANTSLVFFGGRLYALGESDLPYALKITADGDIHTLGRCDFDGKLFMGMTAHPKVDPDNGEVFAFRYGPVPPFVTLFRFDANGAKAGTDVPIFSLLQPSFLHDFAITKRYAIIPDIQLGMRPLDMVTNAGSPVGSNPTKVPRLGVIPRYASDESDIRWFQVPGFNIMHAINAWDEYEDDGDAIVLVAPNVISIEHAIERTELVHCCVERVRLNLKTGVVTRTPISAKNLDFGVVNPNYVGKKNRYVYTAIGEPMPKIAGVVKLDVDRGCEVGSRRFGPGCFGGEPYFVARDPDDPEADEDDGYLVSYVHDEMKDESKFVVMDAKSPSLDIVGCVKLPRRVPYGFHGLFVSDRDLRKQ